VTAGKDQRNTTEDTKMHGIEWKLVKDQLVITIDVSKAAVDQAPPSMSGKTKLVASTGNPSLSIATPHGGALRLQLNLMGKK
jgi:hypothetical protein